MARFVEMKSNGKPRMVNLETVEAAFVAGNGKVRLTLVGGDNDYMDVDESYAEVKRLLMGEMSMP